MILRHPQRGSAFRKRGFFRIVWDAITNKRKQIPFDHRLYNTAADYVINADLIAHGLEPIENGLYSDKYGRDHLVDEVYAELWQEQEQEQEQEPETDSESGESDESNDSSDSEPNGGAGGAGDDTTDDKSAGTDDSDDDSDDSSDDSATDDQSAGTDHDGHDTHLEPLYDGTPEEIEQAEAEDTRELDRTLQDGIEDEQQAIKDGEQKDHGHGAGIGERVKAAASRLSAPVTWRDEFADLLQRTGSGGTTSWASIHRRRYNLYGVVSPVTKGSLNQFAVIIDISYSVDRDALNEFLHAAADMIDELQPSDGALILLTSDHVEYAHEVYSGSELLDLDIPYGGGTDMYKGLEYIEQHGYEPDLVAVFTDYEISGYDARKLNEGECVIILDGQPSYYARRMIEQYKPRVITVDDNALAA
jgi:predicted metal-dependent peptidase